MALIPGGVWEGMAPVEVETYPLLTYSLLPSRSDYTMTGPYRHVFDLRVTAFDKSDSVDAAGAVLDRVYTLLQDASLSMASFVVLYCRRRTSNKMSPVREGVQFQQLVDSYGLEVRPS
jgi:hypothetical protein